MNSYYFSSPEQEIIELNAHEYFERFDTFNEKYIVVYKVNVLEKIIIIDFYYYSKENHDKYICGLTHVIKN